MRVLSLTLASVSLFYGLSYLDRFPALVTAPSLALWLTVMGSAQLLAVTASIAQAAHLRRCSCSCWSARCDCCSGIKKLPYIMRGVTYVFCVCWWLTGAAWMYVPAYACTAATVATAGCNDYLNSVALCVLWSAPLSTLAVGLFYLATAYCFSLQAHSDSQSTYRHTETHTAFGLS